MGEVKQNKTKVLVDDRRSNRSDTIMAADKQQKKPDLGLLEEDDEFEEFPAEEEDAEGEADEVWEDNWDDDNVGEDFSKQLRAELEKQGKNPDGSKPMET